MALTGRAPPPTAADQQPLDEIAPEKLPALSSPEVDGTDVAHIPLEDALAAAVLDPDAAAAPEEAVVFGACVVSLARSPDNRTGVCGLTDGEALVAVVGGDAPVEVSVDRGADLVGRVSGSVVVVVLTVLGLLCVALGDAAAALVEDVPVLPAAFDEAFICEVGGVLTMEPVGELVWACAAPDAASHRMVAKMNGRRIARSFVRRAERMAIDGVPARRRRKYLSTTLPSPPTRSRCARTRH